MLFNNLFWIDSENFTCHKNLIEIAWIDFDICGLYKMCLNFNFGPAKVFRRYERLLHFYFLIQIPGDTKEVNYMMI